MSKFGKYFLLATGFALLATFARIPGAIINVHAHDRGCSVASLKGTRVFNGDGTRGLIRSTRSTNGEIQDWTDIPPSGSYTVDPDCTGSFFTADGTKNNNLIVLDGGKRFFLLSVAPDTITTEEGIRLEVKEKD